MRGGGAGPGRAGGNLPGADQEAEITLTVDEAFRGGRRSITLSTPSGPRNLDVNIPAGVVDGQRIRLAGQGGQGTEDRRVHLDLAPRAASHGATGSRRGCCARRGEYRGLWRDPTTR